MEQKEIFFNNAIDSILSIPIEKHVNSPKKVKSVEFEQSSLSDVTALQFDHQFGGTDGYRFNVLITKVDGQYFWRSFSGNGARYILDVKVVETNKNSWGRDTTVGRYYFDCCDKVKLKRLKEAFNFLVDKIELKRQAEEEKKLKSINSKILINIELSNRFKKYWENITDIDRKAFGDMMSLLLKGHKKPPRSKEHTEKLKCWSKGSIPWNKDKSNVYSDETKEKMSENNAMSKPILVFDKNDKLLYEFNSISKASRVLSINRTFIYRCLIDIRQCDIYKFKYKEL